MGILDSIGNLFGTESQPQNKFNWKELTSEEDVADVMHTSNEKPQVIYKHSSRCATSYFALKNVESISAEDQLKADFHMVDVISRRPTSMHIAEELEIRHESPQLFVIKDGEVIWSGSHNQIQAEVLENIL
ncbi:MAG: bacillithiol system redox-active protein YtxJ [Gracilimonas sp.]|uniref:bacillithiol system redox-active protein YtxJ n=1 Tax=Gracilimonas TaxID=649462 RepID=UPI001B1ACD6B|nr:bacillithiol system redox-active protein YtxJ [Gracilimonas sp.]MBO6587117.1 bacillithiol system redox-active protein YtxJ [Gracilimonas sp.]MBO6614395.1 bacillithiol system redox-active protein YtxJ [Gracilimonas sp.]